MITTKNKEKIEPAKVFGNKQVIGNINWINNEKYSSKELTNVLGIKTGDEYSKEIIEERMYGKVSDLYLDNGYLFFNITVTEKQKNDNTIDLEFKIIEGDRAKIGKVEITGSTEGTTNEILNKIEIKSGDLFSKSKLIQSVRLITEIINQDSEVIDVDVNPLTGSQENEFYIVNLVFKIKDKNEEILITTKKSAEKAAVKVARNPIVIVDGKEFDGEIKDIPVDEIASVSVLKNENASPFNYGERAKDGAIVINTKTKYNSENPEVKLEKQTILELRKKIAQSIKYPVVAQENNQQGVVEIWAFIAKDGTISRITDKKPDGKFINIDEVVVTSLKSGTSVNSEKSNNLDLLVKESKRVIEKLSPLKISELAGETVSFRIRFVLQ